MQTCSSPRHCFSEASASSNASIREPQGAASPELGDSPWHHSTLLLNLADSAYFFIFYFYFFFLLPLHRTPAVFSRKLDVKDKQVWACAMNWCRTTGEQAASCLPCSVALLQCSSKQCPPCAEPAGVWKDCLPALSWAPAQLPQNTESRTLLSTQGPAWGCSSLLTSPWSTCFGQDQTVNRVLARNGKRNTEMECRTVFFLAVLNSQLQLQAQSSNHFTDCNSSRLCRVYWECKIQQGPHSIYI